MDDEEEELLIVKNPLGVNFALAGITFIAAVNITLHVVTASIFHRFPDNRMLFGWEVYKPQFKNLTNSPMCMVPIQEGDVTFNLNVVIYMILAVIMAVYVYVIGLSPSRICRFQESEEEAIMELYKQEENAQAELRARTGDGKSKKKKVIKDLGATILNRFKEMRVWNKVNVDNEDGIYHLHAYLFMIRSFTYPTFGALTTYILGNKSLAAMYSSATTYELLNMLLFVGCIMGDALRHSIVSKIEKRERDEEERADDERDGRKRSVNESDRRVRGRIENRNTPFLVFVPIYVSAVLGLVLSIIFRTLTLVSLRMDIPAKFQGAIALFFVNILLSTLGFIFDIVAIFLRGLFDGEEYFPDTVILSYKMYFSGLILHVLETVTSIWFVILIQQEISSRINGVVTV